MYYAKRVRYYSLSPKFNNFELYRKKLCLTIKHRWKSIASFVLNIPPLIN